MKLETLIGKELCAEIIETREDSDSYEEVVFLGKDIPALNKILTEKLGPALISTEEYDNLNASEEVLASTIAIDV